MTMTIAQDTTGYNYKPITCLPITKSKYQSISLYYTARSMDFSVSVIFRLHMLHCLAW